MEASLKWKKARNAWQLMQSENEFKDKIAEIEINNESAWRAGSQLAVDIELVGWG